MGGRGSSGAGGGGGARNMSSSAREWRQGISNLQPEAKTMANELKNELEKDSDLTLKVSYAQPDGSGATLSVVSKTTGEEMIPGRRFVVVRKSIADNKPSTLLPGERTGEVTPFYSASYAADAIKRLVRGQGLKREWQYINDAIFGRR